MALPFDDATTLLTTLEAGVRQVYEGFDEMYDRFGMKTNRIFKFSQKRIDGDGINIQVKSANGAGSQWTTNINADFPAPDSFQAKYYKVLFSEDPATNHFRRLGYSLQTTHWDIKRRANTKAQAVDYVSELVSDAMADTMESIAVHRHLDSTGRLGIITGTIVQNTTDLLAGGAAYSSGATGGARFTISNGSLAYFKPNLKVSFYTSAGVFHATGRITDYNPADGSVGVWGINATTGNSASTDALAGLVTGDYIYIAGEKDANLLSVGHWFSSPTASESFFGRDRTDGNYRWMKTHRYGPSTARQFTKTDIDTLAIQLGYVKEEDSGGAYVCTTTPELEQRYRNEIGADIIIQYPTAEQKGRMMAEYGFDGSIYRHPQIGRIILNSDPLTPPNKMRFMKLGDWETLSPLGATFEWIPGNTVGAWSRMVSSTAGAGFTTTYSMNGMLAMVDLCRNPRRNAELFNLTA